MKRLSFLQTLVGLPLLGYSLAQKLKSKNDEPKHLLNKFYVGGFQYHEGPSFINQIQEGEALHLHVQPKNQFDKFAVEIYRNNILLGHIPRTDNKHISRLLRQDVKLYCFASEINPEQETWQMLKAEVYL